MSHEVNDFQAQVIERSHEVPVLVDFWAEWCGPCRFLGPVLDKLAGQADGKWELAKVNVDHHPDLSQEYGISGIPDVKLFHKGKPVDGFTGAAPEGAIKKWLEYVLPSPEKEKTDAAKLLLSQGRIDEGRAALESIAAETAKPGEAHLLLGRLSLFDNPQAALEWVKPLGPGSIFAEIAEDIRHLARLLEQPDDQFPEASVREKYLNAVHALRAQDFDKALDIFIQCLQLNKPYDDQGARKACIALFRYLGEHDPLSAKYRRAFSMALS